MELSDEEVPENIDPKEDADPHDTFNVQNDADIRNQDTNSGRASQEASPGKDLPPPVCPLFYPLRQTNGYAL